MALAILFPEAFAGLRLHISKTKLLNTHRSDRHKTDVKRYSVIGLTNLEESSATYLGHFFGRTVEEVKYELTFEPDMPVQITILNKVKDRDAAIAAVQLEVIALFAKARSKPEKPPKGFSTKNWQGFYLWSEAPGKAGLNRFAQAKAEGLVSDGFIETCKTLKISLRRYNT